MRVPAPPVAPSLIVVACLTLLSACNRPDGGTTVTINADGGNVAGAVDGRSGEVKLDLPGIKGSIKLPKIQLDAGNFDLNGVHLYPGSTIESVNIAGDAAGSGKRGRDGAGGLRVRFSSPAGPEAVRDWFDSRLSRAGFSLHTEGADLVGTTDEDKPFRLDLTPQDGGKARGTIVIGG